MSHFVFILCLLRHTLATSCNAHNVHLGLFSHFNTLHFVLKLCTQMHTLATNCNAHNTHLGLFCHFSTLHFVLKLCSQMHTLATNCNIQYLVYVHLNKCQVLITSVFIFQYVTCGAQLQVLSYEIIVFIKMQQICFNNQ